MKIRVKQVDAQISVLVWDAYEATVQLLDSIEKGIAVKSTFAVKILDQGSESRTARALEVFANRHAGTVELQRVPQNIGYAAGHNRLHQSGARRLHSRHLVTVNSDIVFRDHRWLDRMVGFMDENPGVGVAGPAGVNYEREPPERIGWCRMASAEEMIRGHFDSISGSLCIIRQSLIGQIGLFDETFTPGYYEDTDLSFRAKACGWRLGHCPIAYCHQPLGPEKSTSYLKREELSARYGNFQKLNRNTFVSRWLESPIRSLSEGEIADRFPTVYLPAASAIA